jgi:hypothetical protein
MFVPTIKDKSIEKGNTYKNVKIYFDIGGIDLDPKSPLQNPQEDDFLRHVRIKHEIHQL